MYPPLLTGEGCPCPRVVPREVFLTVPPQRWHGPAHTPEDTRGLGDWSAVVPHNHRGTARRSPLPPSWVFLALPEAHLGRQPPPNTRDFSQGKRLRCAARRLSQRCRMPHWRPAVLGPNALYLKSCPFCVTGLTVRPVFFPLFILVMLMTFDIVVLLPCGRLTCCLLHH